MSVYEMPASAGSRLPYFFEVSDAKRIPDWRYQGTNTLQDSSNTLAFVTYSPQNDGQHHETLPYFLVLQIGIVVAQPASVLSRRAYHIYNQPKPHQQEINKYHWQKGITTADNAPRQSCNERYYHHGNGPQRSPVVLQHREQYDYSKRNNRHAIEQSGYKTAQHHIVA